MYIFAASIRMQTSSEKSELKGVADRGHEREDAELLEAEDVVVVLSEYQIRVLMVVDYIVVGTYIHPVIILKPVYVHFSLFRNYCFPAVSFKCFS